MHVSPAGQVAQAAPPTPHAVVLVPDSHLPPLSQQPVGHVERLHAGDLQVPALHVSVDGQDVQATPPVPHAEVVVPDSQNPSASQQPMGHVVGSHATPMHAPPVHESPGGQGRHAAPPVPHARVLVPDSHLPPLSQHPVGHDLASHVAPTHAPAVQESPVGHATHERPPLPHALLLVPGSHTPDPSQHPVGHVAALQAGATHVPAAHVSPEGHARQVLPPVPQAPELEPDSQKPKLSQQPVGHVLALHVAPTQAPAVHVSVGGQGTHAPPPVPQADVLPPGSQIPMLLQQPVGQVEALHVDPRQAPAEHVSPAGQPTHVRPPLPHAEVLVPVSQSPAASQHPAGQVVALQGVG